MHKIPNGVLRYPCLLGNFGVGVDRERIGFLFLNRTRGARQNLKADLESNHGRRERIPCVF